MPESTSRNKYFPEHSQIVYNVIKDNNGIPTTVQVLDGYGKTYSLHDYSFAELEKGGPYGNIFVGRPTSVNGIPNPADYNISKTRPIPENLESTITKTWYGLDKNNILNNKLSEFQINTIKNITSIGSDLKKEFILNTGIDNDKYDKLIQMLVGIAGQESNYGVTTSSEGYNPKYGIKSKLRTD